LKETFNYHLIGLLIEFLLPKRLYDNNCQDFGQKANLLEHEWYKDASVAVSQLGWML
jgi:hypothetical protein